MLAKDASETDRQTKRTGRRTVLLEENVFEWNNHGQSRLKND